ncbi:Peroxin 6 isoform 1 [Hibiscus syriacus]|uniref:Peroxin 6 isoform 1 n=1 Tax=Hibiscus syriacus TaxID=106335 RepID=A0A6A3CE44_HIBSY|nr:Peroxin 6 isoform 1 [Hibiscus syriacus]
MNSCGLSLESAIAVSEKIQFQSPERPDLVLALLRNYGFSKTNNSNLIRKRPWLLLSHPHNILLPKLEFFRSIGLSSSELARTLSSETTLLTRSLENKIIPTYEFLKSVLLSDEKEDCYCLETHYMRKSTLVLAIHALSRKGNKLIWDKCFEVYKRWGWSKDDILSAFRKQPHSMMLSETKITKTMDYFPGEEKNPQEFCFPDSVDQGIDKRRFQLNDGAAAGGETVLGEVCEQISGGSA